MVAFPFADKNHDIPRWVNWIAQDSSGDWWGYSVEPSRHEKGWYENEVGEFIKLGQSVAQDWQGSLRRIEHL